MMWQSSLKTATDRAVSHTDLKMRSLLPKEGIWQCRNEQTGYQAAREHQRGDTAISLPSLQSCSGRTWAFPVANQLLGHSSWKHRKEGKKAYGICLDPSRTFCLKSLPVCIPLCQKDPGYKDGGILHCSQPAAQSRGTARSWQSLPLKSFSTWHQGILYTSTLISPIPYEGGSWKFAFCLK